MRRLALVAAVLVIPLLPAAPAYAADHVICVGSPVGSCDQTVGTILLAIAAADANVLDDTILVGPGTYTDGPYNLDGNAHALTLRGSGPTTILTLPVSIVSQSYVTSSHASVRELMIDMEPAQSSGDKGLSVSGGSTVDQVTVDGTGTSNATALVTTGSQTTSSSLLMPVTDLDSRGVFAHGGNTITDTSISGASGFVKSAPNSTDILSRLMIEAGSTSIFSSGVSTDGGTVEIDDSLIDLGTSAGTGLLAANFNPGTDPETINANHVTIVRGGAGSKGAWASAATPNVVQTSTITLTNSIVRGPATDLVAEAGNTVGGGTSSATIATSYSDWATQSKTATTNGSAQVVSGPGNLNVDPAFVNPGTDYHLTLGSPVVDKGNPAAGGPATDLDAAPRVVDGDGVPGEVRDMGAYELPDLVDPDTTIDSGPSGSTNDATPTFTFSSVPGATFKCQVDAGSFAACASPLTTPTVTDGAHTFSVRATDTAAHTDATPATRSFSVDTVAPQTTITTKAPKRTTKRKAKFGFNASEAGVTFECKLDNRAYRPCTSPKKYRIKLGKHVFSVRATDAVGNVDATPAKAKFRRIPQL